MSKCPGCSQDVGVVAIVDLVYLYVPQDGQLVEQPWHPQCYIKAHCDVTCAKKATSEASEPTYTRNGSVYCRTCGTALGMEEAESANAE